MTWRNGREVSTLTKGGRKTSYEYDVDGLRNLKTNADGSYSVYYWLGELLLAEQRFASATATTPTWTMVFSYDENNTPIGYQLKGTSGVWYYYYYAKNVQGDIVALYRYDKDSDGNKVATHIANYEYDPWGKVLSITNASGADLSGYSSNAAVLNPLRYRGYYYDSESGFYYLQSRYYDPSIGRFINADGYISTGKGFLGYNMFAYCNNNPVQYSDRDGSFFDILLSAVIEAFVEIFEVAEKALADSGANQDGYITINAIKDAPPDGPNFTPPKKGNRKVRNPNGRGNGWLDKNGNVWVWDETMHGGRGWVIQHPDGGHHHEYPGGHVRYATRRVRSVAPSAGRALAGVAILLVVTLDDFVGIVADDGAVALAYGCFMPTTEPYYYCEVCGMSWD